MGHEKPLSERLFEGLNKELSKAGIDLNPDKPLYSATQKACELVAEMTTIPQEFEKAVSQAAKNVGKDLKKKSLYQKLEAFYAKHPGESLFSLGYLAFELNAFAQFLEQKDQKLDVKGHPTVEAALAARALDPKEVIVDFLLQNNEARAKFDAIMEDEQA